MRTRLLHAACALVALSAARGADLTIAGSAMYGPLAVFEEAPVRLEVAVGEGARVVSWQVEGREVGFVGRIWGGDMYDRYKVRETAGDTRFHRPATVAVLRRAGLVALRAEFDVGGGAVLRRTMALGPEGFFLEVEFTGVASAWYEFAAHVVRPRQAPFAEIEFRAEGELRRVPLEPKREYPDLPADLALRNLAARPLALHFGPGMGLHPRVWNDNMSLGLGGTYRGEPLRVVCRLGDAGPAPAFPTLEGDWQPIDFAIPEGARPAVPALAREFGPYGVCNSRPEHMAPLAASGLRWVRLGSFAWAGVEAAPGVRDYAATEASLAAAEREGLAVIGEMSGNPGWATTDGNRRSPPKDWQQWEEHVAQVVARYRERVHVWEIWNEPDIRQFWTGTAEDYARLLKHAYRGAKRADPECLVMSAGLDGSGESYLAKLLELGAGEHCDLVGAHPYAGTVAVAEQRMRIMRRILAFHKLDKPLWITEVGWQSGGWTSGPGVVGSEEIKAERLAEAYPALARHADVVCWYVGVEPGRMYGLLQPTGEAGFVLNPAWFAMRSLALPPAPGIRIETAATARAVAGEAAEIRATVRSDHPVRARWLGLEPAWGESVPVAVAGEATVAVRVQLPEYVRPEQRHLILAVQDETGRHVANQAVELAVENPGRVCDVGVGGDWIKRIDRDGKEAGPWTPAHSLATVPGEGFVQPIRPRNRGNFDDTLDIAFDGPVAHWLDPVPATVTVAAGKAGWVGLRVRVPGGTPPGTYALLVRVRSRTFPAVQAEWRGSYSVVRAPAD